MAKQDLGELGFKESNVETPGGNITDRVDNQEQWTPRLRMHIDFEVEFWWCHFFRCLSIHLISNVPALWTKDDGQFALFPLLDMQLKLGLII